MPGTEEVRSRVNGNIMAGMAGMADVLGSGQSGRGAEGQREEGGGRRSMRRSMRSVGSWHFLAGSWQGAR
jgi:hypothetical protein